MSAAIVYPDVNEFDSLISGDQPVLVDFWAEWCMPCRMLTPVIEKLGEEYDGRAVIAKVNVDEHGALAARFNVQSIPTVILFHQGRIVETLVGMRSEDVYKDILNSVI